MAEAQIAQPGPFGVDLDSGTYWWCACGRSQKQPFCDGSHKGTEFSPVKVELAESRKVYLCGCKRTANQPFCDGSHKNL